MCVPIYGSSCVWIPGTVLWPGAIFACPHFPGISKLIFLEFKKTVSPNEIISGETIEIATKAT